MGLTNGMNCATICLYFIPVKLSGSCRPEVEETPEKLLSELPKGQGNYAETLRQMDGQ